MPVAPPRGRAPRRPTDVEAVRLAVGVANGLWRWRLELTLLCALVTAHVLLAAVVGDVAAGLLVGAVVAATLSVRASRCWLVRALRAAGVRRAWWRAWTAGSWTRSLTARAIGGCG